MITKFDINVDGYWDVIVYCDCILENGIKGFTKTDMDKKLSIVCIGKTFVFEDFFDTLIHEFKHVQSHICEYYNVPENGEQVAYLIGFLTHRFLNKIKKYEML